MNYPKAVWPYSPYYLAWELIFCSGQIWLVPKTMEIIKWWIEAETKQVIDNISWVLMEIDLELKDVVKTTIFLKDIKDFSKVNSIYEKYFSHKPARSTLQVAELPLGALVEIEVIAKK